MMPELLNLEDCSLQICALVIWTRDVRENVLVPDLSDCGDCIPFHRRVNGLNLVTILVSCEKGKRVR